MKIEDLQLFKVTPNPGAPVGTNIFCAIVNVCGVIAGVFLLAFVAGVGFKAAGF